VQISNLLGKRLDLHILDLGHRGCVLSIITSISPIRRCKSGGVANIALLPHCLFASLPLTNRTRAAAKRIL